jgi:hypothetical protein
MNGRSGSGWLNLSEPDPTQYRTWPTHSRMNIERSSTSEPGHRATIAANTCRKTWRGLTNVKITVSKPMGSISISGTVEKTTGELTIVTGRLQQNRLVFDRLKQGPATRAR